jgi:hypothetical protein
MEYLAPLLYPVTDVGRVLRSAVRRVFEHLHDHLIPHPRNNYHPHVLGHRTLALYSMLIVTVKIIAVSAPLLLGQPSASIASAITSTNIFNLTNASRAEFGVPALTLNSKLASAAQAKAQALLQCQCFAHNIVIDGKTVTPWDFIRSAGYSYLTAGENLAIDFQEAEEVGAAWMNSPGHKANIINKNFEEIGIGIAQGEFQGHNSIVVVQEFGTPAVEKVAVTQPAPTPSQTVASAVEPTPAPTAQAPKTVAAAPKKETPSFGPVSASAAAEVPPAAIIGTGVYVVDGQVKIAADTQGAVSKVIAHFGEEAVMLNAKSDTHWEGSVPLDKVVAGSQKVSITAHDEKGTVLSEQIASFSNDTANNFSASPVEVKPEESKHITVFGRTIDLGAFEKQFYLLFITLLLTALIIAIAVRRHVQHVSLVAHSSFVVVLAVLMFVGI